MIQTIAVITIVALAALLLTRRYWRQLGGKSGEISCGCSGGGCQGQDNQCSCLTSLDSLQPDKEV